MDTLNNLKHQREVMAAKLDTHQRAVWQIRTMLEEMEADEKLLESAVKSFDSLIEIEENAAT